MESLTPVSLVHFYDVRSRRIACGVRGADLRSSKHPRQVTCEPCVALIGERPQLGAVPDEAGSAAGAAP
ncbi:hypothetical protein [Anaeromyxobacter paludicola]|uniref:Uncharacterized protein n=1 Tax=Anaeromyxobacter paludicola TaxID=2918171 RepID=A0ABN6NDC6_9BACT|nr:hypothetical protein [Anaeromyxobacter paludicola]BDG10027.1 hypothetical protein AMPC_31400 [Anaeromyxobacter paludicola]